MSNTSFQKKNLISEITKSEYSLELATLENDIITIQPKGKVTIVKDIAKTKPFACGKLRLQTRLQGYITNDNYEPRGFQKLTVRYKEDGLIDRNLVPINRDIQKETEDYITTTDIDVIPKEVDELEIQIENKGVEVLQLKEVKLFPSKDINPYQIVDILEEDTVVTDILNASTSFVDAQMVQVLRTNVMSSTDVYNLTGGNVVDSINIEDYTMSFNSSQLSETNKKQLVVKVRYQTPEGDELKEIPIFHAVSSKHKLRGRAFTIVDPREKFPDMDDVEYETFKLKVWEEEAKLERASIGFEDRGIVKIPVITLGEGMKDDVTGLKGKLRIFVDGTGGNIKYVDSNGIESSVLFNANGVHLKNMRTVLERLERYDNGCLAYFRYDSAPTKIIFNENESGELISATVNNKEVLMPRIKGTLKKE